MSESRLKQFLKQLYPLVACFDRSFSSSVRHPRSKISFRLSRFARVSILVGFFLSLTSFYLFILRDLPSPSSLTLREIPLTTHILDRNGVELYKIYSGQNRTLVRLPDLPRHLVQATLAIEDKQFYTHRGFSFSGVFRAFIANLNCTINTGNTGNCSLQGGSTITQQLIKNSLLSPERTLRRKIRELVLSFATETMYSKDQILEMYLNRIPYGGAAYGVEEAAQTYFGISARDLDLAQSAFLAGLPASPTTYSPYGTHPELTTARQQEVLRQMIDAGYITWEQAETAAAEELTLRRPATDIVAPHFVMYVKDLLVQKYGHRLVESGGLTVHTSLDITTQELAEKIVFEEVGKVARLKVGNGAALVTIPATGEILAMVGSKNYFDLENDGNVNVTLSLRQPGSAIKPVNYALALQNGFTAASILDDSPVTYRIPGQENYSPINYDHRYHGRVTLRTALASSFNIPAVKVLSINGVEKMVEMGQKLGISTWTDPSRFGLSLTLGGGEITMLDLAKVYGTFANFGSLVDLHPVLRVSDRHGRVLEEFSCTDESFSPFESAAEKISCSPSPVLDPRIAFIISDILSDNTARAPTFGYNSLLNISGSVVPVKTGTTNYLRDNWTIGYTSDFLVAVWVGNNDNTPMSYIASGITGASPIWRKITDYLLTSFPAPKLLPPETLLKLAICPSTGQLACRSCSGRTEYFIPGTEPKVPCVDNPDPASPPSPPPSGILPLPTAKPARSSGRDRILEGSSTSHPR